MFWPVRLYEMKMNTEVFLLFKPESKPKNKGIQNSEFKQLAYNVSPVSWPQDFEMGRSTQVSVTQVCKSHS